MLLMLIVVVCYTITSTNDKYAIAKAKMSGFDYTFIMTFSTAVFMTAALPFLDVHFVFAWQTFAVIAACSAVKLTEFLTVSKVLTELSAFELKAWLGITIFFSYFSDIIFKIKSFTVLGVVFITVTVAGLFIISKSNKGKVNYRAVAGYLALYLLSKYGYGLVMKVGEGYVSSNMAVYIAMIVITAGLLIKVKPFKLAPTYKKSALYVFLARIPNVVGIIAENAVIAVSLTDYSLIQPLLLISLFILDIIKNRGGKPLNVLGGVVCIAGIAGLKLFC